MSELMELTNNALKGVMTDAMVVRGTVSNLDECRQTGIYVLTTAQTNCSNPPDIPDWNAGFVEVIKRGGESYFQRITTLGGIIVQRIGTMTRWGSWIRVLIELA